MFLQNLDVFLGHVKNIHTLRQTIFAKNSSRQVADVIEENWGFTT